MAALGENGQRPQKMHASDFYATPGYHLLVRRTALPLTPWLLTTVAPAPGPRRGPGHERHEPWRCILFCLGHRSWPPVRHCLQILINKFAYEFSPPLILSTGVFWFFLAHRQGRLLSLL